VPRCSRASRFKQRGGFSEGSSEREFEEMTAGATLIVQAEGTAMGVPRQVQGPARRQVWL
jgi:hypothetical protein